MVGNRINPYDGDTQNIQAERWFADKVSERSIEQERNLRSQKKGAGKRGRNGADGTRHDSFTTVATCDFETDPFRGPGYEIRPFAAGFYDGTIYTKFWGGNCHEELAAHIKALETPHVIYAHNGGKFDFMYLLSHLERDVFCIGPRIVKAYMVPSGGVGSLPDWRHEFRDSISIIPVPLKHAAEKQSFDYDRMLEGNRDKWRPEILSYLKQDCIGLHETVMKYRQTFGNALTMAGAAMKKLDEAMAPILGRKKAARRMEAKDDEFFRQFYYGGRVQAFEQGIIEPKENTLQIYDINSSYPDVMRRIRHPIGTSFRVTRNIDENTDFASIRCFSDGALPRRDKDTGKLEFPRGVTDDFAATGEEIRTGIELGILRVLKVYEARACAERTTFGPFIDEYWKRRQEAKKEGDAVFDLFWKLVMNGAYGKFAQNPKRFKDTMICRLNEEAPDAEEGWRLEERLELMDVYTRKLHEAKPKGLWRSYINVATGASITGAARASLLRGLASSRRPIYCDTDSIMAEGLAFGAELSGPNMALQIGVGLGQWKLEHVADYAAVCARKLYGIFGARSTDPKVEAYRVAQYRDPYCIKIASKGVRLTAAQILDAAKGGVVEWTSQAPTFRKDGSQWWQKRRVRMVG